ncbi:hypothetical protein PSPO01_10494 [Paraphaeosphaeria sporulosa]
MQDVALWQTAAEAATSAASSSPHHAASAQKQSSHLFPNPCKDSEVPDVDGACLASSPCALASNRPRWPWPPTFYCWLRWRTPDHGYYATLAYRNCTEGISTSRGVGCAIFHASGSYPRIGVMQLNLGSLGHQTSVSQHSKCV